MDAYKMRFKNLSLFWNLAQLINISQNIQLQHSTTNGVILTGNTNLALRNVSRLQAGNYTCTAFNVEGDGRSPPLHVQIVCKFLYNIHYFLEQYRILPNSQSWSLIFRIYIGYFLWNIGESFTFYFLCWVFFIFYMISFMCKLCVSNTIMNYKPLLYYNTGYESASYVPRHIFSTLVILFSVNATFYHSIAI